MSLIDGYKASLKSLEVEEPIDVFVHRPLGYLVALAAFRTPITPNLITLVAILFGLGAGVCILWPFPYHLPAAGVLILVSTVLDCADGQLARMRKTSSTLGRMIDGVADSVVSVAVVLPTVYLLWQQYNSNPWVGGAAVVLAICAIVTSSFHTSMYDHFKNAYLQFTHEGHSDGESYVAAQKRWEARKASESWWLRIVWQPYLLYTKGQADILAKFDPSASGRVEAYPPYNPQRAATYRAYNAQLMRVWRSFFGFGTLMFGLALFVAIGRPDVYLAIRLVLFNGIFYLYLRPAQRKASRRAFEQCGIRMPDQAGATE